MKHVVLCLGACALLAVPALADTWTLASDIEVTRQTGPLGSYPPPRLAVSAGPQEVVVSITDFFYHAGGFRQPWMSVANRGKATLTIGTRDTSSWFSSNKDEHVRSIDLKISRRRLPAGTVLYVYNEDTGEVMGHALVR